MRLNVPHSEVGSIQTGRVVPRRSASTKYDRARVFRLRSTVHEMGWQLKWLTEPILAMVTTT